MASRKYYDQKAIMTLYMPGFGEANEIVALNTPNFADKTAKGEK